MPGYVLSPQAADDLESIFEYTLVQWGEEQFERYRRSLTRALEAVGEDPMLPGSRAREDLMPGCRFYRVEHHYIAYRKGKGVVEVGRILHERMNFELHVSDESFG